MGIATLHPSYPLPDRDNSGRTRNHPLPRPLPEGRGSCSAYGSPPAPAGDCWRFPKLRTVPSPFRERELFGVRKPTSPSRQLPALPQTQDRPLSLQGEGAVRRTEPHQRQPTTAGASPKLRTVPCPFRERELFGVGKPTSASRRLLALPQTQDRPLSLQGEGAVRRTETHQRQPATTGASPNSGPSPSPFRERELFGVRNPTSASRRLLALPQTQDRPLSLQGEGAVRRTEAHQRQPATTGASPNSGPSPLPSGRGSCSAYGSPPAPAGDCWRFPKLRTVPSPFRERARERVASVVAEFASMLLANKKAARRPLNKHKERR